MNVLKKLLIIGVVVGIGWFSWQHRASLSPEVLRAWIGRFGAGAPFVYVLLYALNTVTLLPPIAVMSLTAGLAFGSVMGFLGIMAGAMVGSAATFFISRKLGRGFVEKRLQGKFKSLDEKLEKRGFATVLFFRVVPLVPYEVMNYAPGLSRISFRDYWVATFLGLLPGAAVSAFFGNSLATLKSHPKNFIIGLAAMVALIAIPTIYLKVRSKKTHGTD